MGLTEHFKTIDALRAEKKHREANVFGFTDKCRHFNGLMNKVCKAGVEYDVVRDSESPARFPCWQSEGISTVCPLASFPTQEEGEAHEDMVQERLKRYFAAIADGTCPNGHGDAKPLKQVGNCVYGSCGCRLYQGRLK